jgi:FkbM family methyltransferase
MNWLHSAGARRERLEFLLSETSAAAEQRQREALDQAASGCGGRIVIYGSGGLGRQVLNGLRAHGTEPVAFVDRNPRAWGCTVESLAVLSPEDAARQFGANSLFVIAVWNPAAVPGLHSIADLLVKMGCRHVAPFAWLFWKFPQDFLPFYLWDLPSRVLEKADEVRRGYSLFPGARSQSQCLDHLQFRLTADFRCLRLPEEDPQYFPARLFRPRTDECFVDCGAFDGDSLREFAQWTGGSFRKAIAFEADPTNFTALERTVDEDNRLRGRAFNIQQAVGLEKCTLRFAASGLASAALSESGDLEVACTNLDESLASERPTYIKMDIEGAEMDALLGSVSVLRENQPTLAICAYHSQDHLWLIPQRIHDLMPEAKLIIRPHCVDGFDLVCYALTPGRETDMSVEDLAL